VPRLRSALARAKRTPKRAPRGLGVTSRFFNGRESWVFRAHALDELCGHHPDLVEKVLPPGEAITYLVYSPLRKVDAGPFELRGPGGSHALAITRDRIIISRDPHQPGLPRTVCQVPFASILTIELGEALALVWFVVRFAEAGKLASETVFFQSSGIEHFRGAVQAWRANGIPTAASDRDADAWESICAQAPPYLRNQLAPLILEGERPRAVLKIDETWCPTAGHRIPTCASAAAACVITDRACLLVQSERPYQPGALVFAVNATGLEHRALRAITLTKDGARFPELMTLVLDTQIESVERQVKLPVGRTSSDALDRFLADARRASGAHVH
jgi:hypothetical protein